MRSSAADGNIPQMIGGADMLWFFAEAAGMLLAVLFWAARKLRLTVPAAVCSDDPHPVPPLVSGPRPAGRGRLFRAAGRVRPLLGGLPGEVGCVLQAGGAGGQGLGAGTPGWTAMRAEAGLRRAFWPKRGNGGLEIGFDTFVKPDRHTDLRIGFGNFAEPDGHADLRRRYLTNRVR